MVSFYAEVKFFRFWPKTMDYKGVFTEIDLMYIQCTCTCTVHSTLASDPCLKIDF